MNNPLDNKLIVETVKNEILHQNVLIDESIFNNLKFIEYNVWQSPQGVIYGYDRKFGNTLNHISSHMEPSAIKKIILYLTFLQIH